MDPITGEGFFKDIGLPAIFAVAVVLGISGYNSLNEDSVKPDIDPAVNQSTYSHELT